MKWGCEEMPSTNQQLNALVDQQTRLFNADAPEPERIVIFKQIVAKQEELRRSGR